MTKLSDKKWRCCRGWCQGDWAFSLVRINLVIHITRLVNPCMLHWERNSKGRLERTNSSTQVLNIGIATNTMEPQGEDQLSQHGPNEENFHLYRSMRDHMHPPRMSAPSCIVPPSEQMIIRPYLVPLLPQFHGMENENPYTHIKDFEEVCHTFQEGAASIDLMRLKLFPFTLKDKAKVWLNSLRPRSIRSWPELQAEFLKKFFPAHRTSGLKRQISNFVAMENEKFYACWERYMEAVNACPHHGFDTWMLIMDEPHGKDSSKVKPQNNSKGGMYTLNEDVDVQVKMATLSRRLEELEARGANEIKVVNDVPMQIAQCSICQSGEHLVSECPTIPTVREMFMEQANVVGFVKHSNSSPFSNTLIGVEESSKSILEEWTRTIFF
ncbi:hypothetical protein CK203_095773 [Vitis vinifera]|uniref:Retrotransposon gag domain-containing protein n=1 Tax=Vitis vinifera TaxID=29760 RepID=A0A438BQZ6_VITVI|nr:hypothetical protein CK203_095773 [Vitis vinifera]